MAANEDQDAVAKLATEAIGPIEEELRQRLAVELSDRDVLAIESALLKGFINGMRAGASEAAEGATDLTEAPTSFGPTSFEERQILARAELDTPLPWLDPWADRYGDER